MNWDAGYELPANNRDALSRDSQYKSSYVQLHYVIKIPPWNGTLGFESSFTLEIEHVSKN